MLPTDFTLETARCRLRHVHVDDIPHVFSATRYPGFNDGMLWDPPEKIEDLQQPHENACQTWAEGTGYVFSIEEKGTQKFIGRIGLRPGENGTWNMGFWTHPELQGQGYMSEAAAAVRDLAFARLEARRLEACHALWNKASERVLQKIGMCFVQYLPQGFQKRGEWVEENLLAITREEWEKGELEGV